MLRFRLIAAALIIAPLLGLLAADYNWTTAPGAIMFPLGGLFVLLGGHELCVMMRKGGYAISYPAAMAGAAGVWLSCGVAVYWPLSGSPYPVDCALGELGWPLGALGIAVMLAFAPALRSYNENSQRPLASVALTVMPSAYVAMPLSFFVWLRLYDSNQWGMLALISVIAVVKMADVGAYAVGRMIGKTKLAPQLSPGKTVEGACGAVLAAALTSVAFFLLAPARLLDEPPAFSGLEVALSALYGVLLALAGMVGDLAESLIKRDVKCKDSGHLPGLGGVLDILDSLVFAAPLGYLCWVTGLVGPK